MAQGFRRWRRRERVLVMKRVAILSFLFAVLGVLAGATSALAETTSFTTAGCQTWTAPNGVASVVQIEATGAKGASGGGLGGVGDGVSASLSGVSAGQSLDVCVDVNGGGGGLTIVGGIFNGGDGGGASGVG